MLDHPGFPSAYTMQCMLKSDIYFNSKSRVEDQKGISSGLGDRLDLDWKEIFGRV
jgi:hypothetical protein